MYKPRSVVVLVVEDDPILRLSNVALLEDAGFTAVEAANADEAIAILEQRLDIQIVFTDIEMPGSMDGLRLARAIRDRWPPVQLVIASGRFAPTAQEMPDGSRFFSKPFRSEDLIAAMCSLAELNAARRDITANPHFPA